MNISEQLNHRKIILESFWIKFLLLILVLFLISILIGQTMPQENTFASTTHEKLLQKIKLPSPNLESKTSIEYALNKRRSIRNYKEEPISLQEASQLLWAAQGVTSPDGARTTPSAGALYPLEIYLVSKKIDGLSEGVFQYNPSDHSLSNISNGDKLNTLCAAALSQESVKEAPAIIVITAVFSRTTSKYGERGKRYVYMEAGHAAQNIYLQAVSEEIGTVTVGAFSNSEVSKILSLAKNEVPIYLIPLGKN